MDEVFNIEKKAIILEDDTLPNLSFFKLCEDLLHKYESDESIYHISGCNFNPDICKNVQSYFITSIIHIWGWATWANRWENYEPEMKSWKKQNKRKFLKTWCINPKVS